LPRATRRYLPRPITPETRPSFEGAPESQPGRARKVAIARALGRPAVAAQEPVHGDAAKLGDALQRLGPRTTVAAFIPEHGVPTDADPGGEAPLGEAEAGAYGAVRSAILSVV
jgi:hypothetical protein